MGHRIDQDGLHPVQGKVDAINCAREPENVYGKDNSNTDCLSRLPLPVTVPEVHEERVLLIEELDASPITAEEIIRYTRRDPMLAHVHEYLMRGWPDGENSVELSAYRCRRDEMSVQDGCVLWDARVVIPQQCRQAVMQELHLAHPGINHMKSLARSYVWWPAMDNELEKLSNQCELCQLHSRSRLALLNPGLQGHVCKKQTKMNMDHDHGTRKREFAPGDNVYVKNFGPGLKWLTGTIRHATGPVSYTVELADGRECRRHVDNLRGRCVETPIVVRKSRRRHVDNLHGRCVETPTVVRKPRRRHVDHLRGRCVETPTVVRKPRVVQCNTERAVTDKPPTKVCEVPTTLPTLERSVSRDRSSNERVSRSSNQCVSVNDENIVNNHIDEITHIAETPCDITPVRRSSRQRVAPAWQADYVVKCNEVL